MKKIAKSEAGYFENSRECTGVGYGFGDKDLDIARIQIIGRYPKEGFAVNDVCKEIGYVVNGTGSVVVKDQPAQQLQTGDAVMIAPGEPYYWEGEELELIMPCAPAFYPEQHRVVGL